MGPVMWLMNCECALWRNKMLFRISRLLTKSDCRCWWLVPCMFAVSGNPSVVQLFIGPVKCTSFSLQYVNCWQQGAAADGPRWAVLKPQGCSSTSPGQCHCHCIVSWLSCTVHDQLAVAIDVNSSDFRVLFAPTLHKPPVCRLVVKALKYP